MACSGLLERAVVDRHLRRIRRAQSGTVIGIGQMPAAVRERGAARPLRGEAMVSSGECRMCAKAAAGIVTKDRRPWQGGQPLSHPRRVAPGTHGTTGRLLGD